MFGSVFILMSVTVMNCFAKPEFSENMAAKQFEVCWGIGPCVSPFWSWDRKMNDYQFFCNSVISEI